MKKIHFVVAALVVIVSSASLFVASADESRSTEKKSFSPAFRRQLARNAEMLSMTEAPSASTSNDEHVLLWNPISFSISSGCVGSACGLSGCVGSACGTSGCVGSGCGGSGCVGSGCTGSACGGSGCVGSACAASGCVGSGCLGSGCVGSACLGSGCVVSACLGSGCGGSACIGSGCIGSACSGSICGGSVCTGSLCAGPVCPGPVIPVLKIAEAEEDATLTSAVLALLVTGLALGLKMTI